MVIIVMLVSAIVLMASDDSDASSGSWKCTIEIDGNDIKTMYSKDGSELVPMRSVDGTGKTLSERAGDWGFDEDGYGPFGSFYAAFDSSGKLVCHLDPNNLKHDLDGDDISSQKYNIMWCLPKHYVSVDGNTLTISSSKSDGEVAKSFVIEDIEYNYLAFGVYEATFDSTTKKLGSKAGTTVQGTISLDQFRSYAAANEVDDGIALLWNYHMMQTYRQCAIAVMGSVNSQGVIGNGICQPSSILITGRQDGEGPYEGNTNGWTDEVSCFIDNAWGNKREYVDDAYWTSFGIVAGQNREPKTGSVTAYQTTIPLKFLESSKRGYGTAPSTDLDSWGLPTQNVAAHDDEEAPDSFGPGFNGPLLAFGGTIGFNSDVGVSCFDALDRDYRNDSNGSRLVFLFQTDPTVHVQYDHSDLKVLLEEYGYNPNLVDGLPDGITVDGHDGYGQLDDVPDGTGFRHVGWIVGDKEYPATHPFVKKLSHTAKSVWVVLPAVTYDHSRLIAATGDPDSAAELSNGLRIDGNDRYEQLPDRDGYTHVGWLADGREVGPTDAFVTRQSHTAISLWTAVPTVVFDHGNLTGIVGSDAEGVSNLVRSMPIDGNPSYPRLPDTAGYRHVGWDIGGTVVGPTGDLQKDTTHIAKSIWEKTSMVIPIIQDDEDVIEVVMEEESEPWLGKDGKDVLLVAIIMAIIAELAVLATSERR